MAFSIKNEMPAVVQEYSLYLRNVRGLSPKTVNEYCLDLRTFFRFMKWDRGLVNSPLDASTDLRDIDLEFIQTIRTADIFAFMNFVADERNNMSSTRQRKSSSLKSFFKYLTVHEKLLKDDPTESLSPPKKRKSLPHFLSLEQSVELLNSVDDGPYQERDRCIITLFLNCGMRLSELVGLNVKDVIWNNSTVRILGKGNKERIVYLNDACLSAINSYLAVRPKDGVRDRDALFLSRLKSRISPKTVQYIIKKYLDKIGLGGPGYSVHKLRHTAATLMYQYGNVDIRILQDILGHTNLGTTEIYTHTSSSQMEAAIRSNPLGNLESPSKPKKSPHKSEKQNKEPED